MKATTRAVAYYRMSSDRQETSIGDQRKAVEKFASENGYEIVAEYADAGISGWKSDQRPEFMRLIDDAPGGKFQAILCWDIDRFSRFDPLEANHYWYLLDRAGVQLVTVAQGKLDWHDLGGWLSASVMQHGKAQYVKDLARNSARGMREAKLAGKWCAPPPFGYRLENGRLTPGDPTAVAAVQRIFNMRANGYELAMIVRSLNADGILTPRGKRWTISHLGAILTRDAYVGNTPVGKHASGKFSRVVDVPEVIEGTHEPIVDRDTWAAVQSMGRRKRRGNGRHSGRLSGIVMCGRCGGKMYVHKRANGSRFYTCSTYVQRYEDDGRTCDFCSVRMDSLEAAVLKLISERLLLGSPEKLEAEIARILKRNGGRTAKNATADVKRRLAKLDGQIERATDQLLLIDPDFLPAAQEKLRAMRAEREALAAQLAPRDLQAMPTAAQIAATAWELPRIMERGEPEVARVAVQQVVEEVVVNFEPDEARRTAKRNPMRCTGGGVRIRFADNLKMGHDFG